MEQRSQDFSIASDPFYAAPTFWADGFTGQEDELEDVHNGILEAPTDDEADNAIDEANNSAAPGEAEDEDDALIKKMLKENPAAS